MDFKDYYTTLGVSKTATDKEIKQAFRKLARKYHPDVNPGDKARRSQVQGSERGQRGPERSARSARSTTSSAQTGAPTRTRRPARIRTAAVAVRRAVEHARRPRRLPHHDGRRNGGDVRRRRRRQPVLRLLQDVLRRHGRRRNRPARAADARGRAARKGQDVEHPFELDLEDAIRGSVQRLQLRHDGHARTVEVRIPAGVTDGSRVRVAGEGGRGTGSAPSGDLYLRVQLKPHPVFDVKGRDVYTRARVPVPIAVLGGEVDVVTPEVEDAAVEVAAGHAERPAIPPARPRAAERRQAGRARRSLRERRSGDSEDAVGRRAQALRGAATKVRVRSQK